MGFLAPTRAGHANARPVPAIAALRPRKAPNPKAQTPKHDQLQINTKSQFPMRPLSLALLRSLFAQRVWSLDFGASLELGFCSLCFPAVAHSPEEIRARGIAGRIPLAS